MLTFKNEVFPKRLTYFLLTAQLNEDDNDTAFHLAPTRAALGLLSTEVNRKPEVNVWFLAADLLWYSHSLEYLSRVKRNPSNQEKQAGNKRTKEKHFNHTNSQFLCHITKFQNYYIIYCMAEVNICLFVVSQSSD